MRKKFFEITASMVKNFRFTMGRERAILLICMGIALLFWMFVKLSKTYQTSRMVPLEYRLPLGMQFREPPPSGLEATFSGSGWDLMMNYVFQRGKVVVFELPAMLRQEIERPEIINKIEESLAIKVIDLSRNYLLLLLDSTASKTVKVVLDAEISFAQDFNYRGAVQLMPDSVTVFGSISLLDQVASLHTEHLTLKNLETDVSRELKILNPNPGLLRISEEKTNVYIPVEQYTEKSFFIPIQMVNMQDSIAVIPSSAEIKCVVGLSHYDNLDESDFAIEANFENVLNFQKQNTVPLTLTRQPDWVRSVEYFPKAVQYLIIQ
jgi:hypothetical protein